MKLIKKEWNDVSQQLVVGFLTPRYGFNPRSVHMELVT
jgi:hypothetical protein